VIPFTKMQGLGNDYVYVDNRNGAVTAPGPLAIKVSDRHFGIGSDGLVLIENSDVATARMRMFNADGSESEMCGNAIRCVARFVWERWNVRVNPLTVETKAGIKTICVAETAGVFSGAAVDMGEPILEPSAIPVQGTTNKIVIQGLDFVCVSMGNPHAVTFVDNTQEAPVLAQGHALETDPIFPAAPTLNSVKSFPLSAYACACGNAALAKLSPAAPGPAPPPWPAPYRAKPTAPSP
jgi:diaminopimelate epimerase